MNKTLLALMIGCSLCLSGCFEKDFSRYPSVSVPQYTENDYLNLLADKKPEVAYNSIVILGQQAEEMGRKLSDEKTDKNSAGYITALNTYKKIVEQLSSRDARVVAASLRFLQLFSNSYKAKAELVKPVLQVRNNDPQVRYEQITTLNALVNNGSNIPDPVVRALLNSPSWIVSHSAYLLVNTLGRDPLRLELINKYKGTKDEQEKLLLLTAFEDQFSDPVAAFLFNEALSTDSVKIRHAIFDILGNAKDQDKVLSWLGENYGKVIASDGRYLFQGNISAMSEKFSSRVLITFLNNGFVPDGQFLGKLNNLLEDYISKKDISNADKEKLNNLLAVEKALLQNKALSEQWEAIKENSRVLNARLTQLQNEFDVITKEYTAKLDELFKKNNISDEKNREYIKNVLSTRNGLGSLLINEKQDSN
jgi:hypothetical protein